MAPVFGLGLRSILGGSGSGLARLALRMISRNSNAGGVLKKL